MHPNICEVIVYLIHVLQQTGGFQFALHLLEMHSSMINCYLLHFCISDTSVIAKAKSFENNMDS